MKRPFLILSLLLLPAGAGAQEWVLDQANLPRSVHHRLLDLYRAPGTVRFDGDARIDASRMIDAPVVATGGTLTITGRVNGNVLVLNGDVVLEEGGKVAGDVTVIGGTAKTLASNEIDGTLTVYSEGRRLVEGDVRRRRVRDVEAEEHEHEHEHEHERDDEDAWYDDDDEWSDWTRWRDLGWGDSRLSFRLGETYNRVEGLPLQFGPVVRTDGSNPLRIEAFATYRTEDGAPEAAIDHWGYQARIEQFLGGRGVARIGATAFSQVRSVESWQLRDIESSLATLLFHRDPRDHYQTIGWSAYLRIAPPRLPIDVVADFRQDDFSSVGVADPWTVFGDDDDDAWRRQPLMHEGELRSVGLTARLRSRRGFDGWRVDASLRSGLDGSLRSPGFVYGIPGPGPDPLYQANPARSRTDFTSGLLDVRRYDRAGRDGQLALRFVGGGALDDGPLPAQLQHAFGGPGGMAGFALDEADCGARVQTVQHSDDEGNSGRYYPYYGCDRFVMGQAEIRGGLDFGWEWDHVDEEDEYGRHERWGHDIDFDAGWVAFVDVGRGWTRSTLPWARDTRTMADAGIGVLLGDLGFYWAVPVTGDDRSVRFSMRLGRRF